MSEDVKARLLCGVFEGTDDEAGRYGVILRLGATAAGATISVDFESTVLWDSKDLAHDCVELLKSVIEHGASVERPNAD